MYKINKTSHNWLAVKTGNLVFERYASKLNGVVADVGCGRSPFKQDIFRTAESYIGVDWQNSLHDQSNVDVFSDLNKEIKLPDVSVDSVIAFHVMEHLCEPERFLTEIFRIMKPGGFLLIAVPFNWHLHEIPYDYYRYTPYCLDYLLKKHGYSQIQVTTEGGFFGTVTLKCNYFLKRILRGPLRYLGIPFWFLNQCFAGWLDRKIKSPNECTAVTAVAYKPV
jgi:SAM-dependent methyltransferase